MSSVLPPSSPGHRRLLEMIYKSRGLSATAAAAAQKILEFEKNRKKQSPSTSCHLRELVSRVAIARNFPHPYVSL